MSNLYRFRLISLFADKFDRGLKFEEMKVKFRSLEIDNRNYCTVRISSQKLRFSDYKLNLRSLVNSAMKTTVIKN